MEADGAKTRTGVVGWMAWVVAKREEVGRGGMLVSGLALVVAKQGAGHRSGRLRK